MEEAARSAQARPAPEEQQALDRIRIRSEAKVLRALRGLAPLLLVAGAVLLVVLKDLLHWAIAVPVGVIALWLWNTVAVRLEELECAINGLRTITEARRDRDPRA